MVAGGAALVAASTATGLSLAPAWAGLLFGNFWRPLLSNHLKNMQEQVMRYSEETW